MCRPGQQCPASERRASGSLSNNTLHDRGRPFFSVEAALSRDLGSLCSHGLTQHSGEGEVVLCDPSLSGAPHA